MIQDRCTRIGSPQLMIYVVCLPTFDGDHEWRGDFELRKLRVHGFRGPQCSLLLGGGLRAATIYI
jgi:hypothetical protein